MSGTYSISDLISDPSLGTELVAGANGSDRVILWAHSCELPDPERWLGPDELLMTVGLCIPAGSMAQREFIVRLNDAGVAGIAIGDDGLAPRLTKALFDQANQLGFPVLR